MGFRRPARKKAHMKIRKQKAWVVVGISTDIWSLSA